MQLRLPVILILLFVLALHAFADLQKGWDAFYKKDYATALKEWKPLAEQGHAWVQSMLGYMYSRGKGVPEDDREAVKWYRLAAEQGHAEAQTSLGEMYRHGRGVPEDRKEAVKWFRLAAEQGHVVAQFLMGYMHSSIYGVGIDSEEAFKWYTLAAEQGYADAQYDLGAMYANGNGAPRDQVKGDNLITLAANQGHTQAQYMLGGKYAWGDIHENLVSAYMWYNLASRHPDAKNKRKAVARRMTSAQIAKAQELSQQCLDSNYQNCGNSLRRASTVTSGGSPDFQKGLNAYLKNDYLTTLKEWKLLAESGDPMAQTNLGYMYDKGIGVPEDNREAVKWYRLSAKQGVSEAQFNLAFMYYFGKGVPKDYVSAYLWFNVASSLGHEQAIIKKRIISFEMTSPQTAKAQELSKECLNSNYQNCEHDSTAIAVPGDYQKGLDAYQEHSSKGLYAEIRTKYYAIALQEWKPLAEQGHAWAQVRLGTMYYDGVGVPQDYKEAEKWYLLAAEQELANAYSLLGDMYATPNGVLEDYVEAVKWRRLVAEQGNEYYASKFDMSDLAGMYTLGLGVPKDYVLAYMWNNLAFLLDHKSAKEDELFGFDALAKKMTPSQIAQAQELSKQCYNSNYKDCD